MANTLIFAQSTFPLSHVLVTFAAHYALESLLLLPQSDCYHFDFWQFTLSFFSMWIHLTKSQHMRGRPDPFISMSLVILRCAFKVFYCFLQQAHNVQTDWMTDWLTDNLTTLLTCSLVPAWKLTSSLSLSIERHRSLSTYVSLNSWTKYVTHTW